MDATASISPDERHSAHWIDPTAPWPVDLTHLRRYTLGDKQLEIEILGLFAAELPKTLAALKDASTPKAWHVAAHTLKGSARAVGAWRLARAALAAEEQAERSGSETALAALASVEAAAAEAVGYIRDLSAN